MHSDAGRDEPGPGLRELDPAAFCAELGALMEVYAAAMHVPPAQLPGRRAVMESHLGHPAFRAIALTAPLEPARPTRLAGDAVAPGTVIAFSYGFHGTGGQWWHDLVRAGVAATAGAAAAEHWLDDSFEVAELHVRPEYHRRGLGRRLLFTLTGGRPERTAVLSTMDLDSPARHLYRGVGFTDLLTGYRFSGADAAYAVMGAALPLSARLLRSRYW